ncbi:MAG TPA: DoxX family membrane protein [Pseudonocardiaceae bacterium]|nr:DoxX family membrane protein [Pseudonocardiaceae bacterium]
MTRNLLWSALAAQLLWVVLNATLLHREPGEDVLGVLVLAVCAVFAVLHRKQRWLTVVVRVVMAVEFLLAVADRFGWLGPAGAPGVSWGDFQHFVAYTRSMSTFLPAGLAPTLAVLATVAELTLGVALLVGFRLRVAALGSAALLTVYAVMMLITLPAAEQFHYNVLVLAAAMCVLATADRLPLTVLTRVRPGALHDAAARSPRYGQ